MYRCTVANITFEVAEIIFKVDEINSLLTKITVVAYITLSVTDTSLLVDQDHLCSG